MTDCIESTYFRDDEGYAWKAWGGHRWGHHRLVVAEALGLSFEEMRGLEVDHLCKNRACINIEHLELVTSEEHRGRQPKGVEHWKTTLSELSVVWIRHLAATGCRQKDIALVFGLKRRQISRIVSRQNWSHVK